MGLTEVENDRVTNGDPDSYGPTSAIRPAGGRSLNANAPAGTTYALRERRARGHRDHRPDPRRVDLPHPETVEEAGTPAMQNDPAFSNVARNPLAQTFREKASWLESSRSCIQPLPGQGQRRRGRGQRRLRRRPGHEQRPARAGKPNAVTAWLATYPTGDHDPDILIIGDLNAYAKEKTRSPHIIGAGLHQPERAVRRRGRLLLRLQR